jgi:hypothetical protein
VPLVEQKLLPEHLSSSPVFSVTAGNIHLFEELDLVRKKSLKIPKGQSKSVYRRRTDNTMAKRKSTKGQTRIYKTFFKDMMEKATVFSFTIAVIRDRP